MKVVASENIESLKYGTVVKGSEIEVEPKIGESWIKQGLAYGKDETNDSHKGVARDTKETKKP